MIRVLPSALVFAAAASLLAMAPPAAAQEGSAFDRFLDDANRLLDSAGDVVRQGIDETTGAINRTLVMPAPPSHGMLATALVGAPVVDPQGRRVADIADLVIGPDGAVMLAVLRRGGTFGYGGELVAADYALLEPLTRDGRPAFGLQQPVEDLPPYRAAGSP